MQDQAAHLAEVANRFRLSQSMAAASTVKPRTAPAVRPQGKALAPVQLAAKRVAKPAAPARAAARKEPDAALASDWEQF
jgi:hypothetical protein